MEPEFANNTYALLCLLAVVIIAAPSICDIIRMALED